MTGQKRYLCETRYMGEWNRFGNECFEVFWFEIPGYLNPALRTEREAGYKNLRFH